MYAAFKRQFGDLEFRANRVLGLYTFILAYSTAFALTFALVSAWVPSQEGDVIAALLVSIVFISAAPAVQGRFQRWFEHLAYGARYDPDEVLTRFSQNLPTASDPEKLVHLIADEITPSLFVRQSALYLLDDRAALMYSRNLRPEDTDLSPEEIATLLQGAGHYLPPLSKVKLGRAGSASPCSGDRRPRGRRLVVRRPRAGRSRWRATCGATCR